MITGYVGRPGSGKSLDATKRMIEHLKAGRLVASNIEGMDLPKCQVVIKEVAGLTDLQFMQQFIFLSKEDTLQFWKTVTVDSDTEFERQVPMVPHGSLVILDEVHKDFSNRKWATSSNQEFADWASTHRHYGYDVILITQDIEKIDKHVRSLIEVTYFYRKVNFFGSLIKEKYIKYTYDGDDHNGQPMCNPSYHSYEKNYYNCYQSYAVTMNREVGVQKNVNIFMQPVFFIIPAVLALFLYFFFAKSSFATGDLFGTKKYAHTMGTRTSGSPPPPVAKPSISVPLPPVPPAPSQAVQNKYSSSNHYGAFASNAVRVIVKGFVQIDERFLASLSDGRIVKLLKKPVVGLEFNEKLALNE